MLKTASRLIGSAILLVLSGLMVAFAHYAPDSLFAWYHGLSQSILSKVGRVTALLPFSLAEVLLYLLILWVIYDLVGVLRRRIGLLSWLAGLLEGASLLVFVFMAVWGLNYFDPTTTADRLGLEIRPYSTDELRAATEYYLAQANDYAQRMERDDSGTTANVSFHALAERTATGFDSLAEEYDGFVPSVQTPKPVLASAAMSYSGISGIFLCLTAEANVNDDGPVWTLPFTMCHERAHAQGIAPENECNFVGFLAAIRSGDDLVAYSGYYHALIYCYNALYSQSRDAASDIWSQRNAALAADLNASIEHYRQFEGKVQQAAEKVNDTYLKTMEQSSGVKSYGEVADYLIAWYLAEQGG